MHSSAHAAHREGHLTVTSPADGRTLGEVPITPLPEVAAAAERAARAFAAWRRTPLEARLGLLRRLRRALIQHRHEIAELVALEQGKPLTEALLLELIPALDTLTYLIHHTPRLAEARAAPPHNPFFQGRRAHYRFKPYGPWAVITPWNYPFAIPFVQLASLAVTGNVALLKPSPYTPLTAQKIAELFQEAGFPPDWVQLIQGGAAQAEALITHPEVRGVLFTGSSATGRKVMALAAQGPKKVLLELGGKDAAIVLDDADLEYSAQGVAWAATMNAGQTCAAIERVYVQEALYPRFTEHLQAALEALRVGHPLTPGVEVGPLIAPFQVEKVARLVEAARTQGGQVRTGGRRLEALGPTYYAPTLVANPAPETPFMCEEAFGPVVGVVPVRDEAEAVRAVNASPYGLTASIWTQSPQRAQALAPQLDVGVATVNHHADTYAEAAGAWGGVKGSGFGRTHGPFGLLELVQLQYISEAYPHAPALWWYPYTERLYRVIDATLILVGEPGLARKFLAAARLFPHLGYLARRLPLYRVLPALLRYAR